MYGASSLISARDFLSEVCVCACVCVSICAYIRMYISCVHCDCDQMHMYIHIQSELYQINVLVHLLS